MKKQTNNNDKWLSTSVVADRLGITQQSVRNLCKQGLLKYKRHGEDKGISLILISENGLKQFINNMDVFNDIENYRDSLNSIVKQYKSEIKKTRLLKGKVVYDGSLLKEQAYIYKYLLEGGMKEFYGRFSFFFTNKEWNFIKASFKANTIEELANEYDMTIGGCRAMLNKVHNRMHVALVDYSVVCQENKSLREKNAKLAVHVEENEKVILQLKKELELKVHIETVMGMAVPDWYKRAERMVFSKGKLYDEQKIYSVSTRLCNVFDKKNFENNSFITLLMMKNSELFKYRSVGRGTVLEANDLKQAFMNEYNITKEDIENMREYYNFSIKIGEEIKKSQNIEL